MGAVVTPSGYWARISKLVKGCRRHSYFGMKIRVGDKLTNQSSRQKRKLVSQSIDSTLNPRDICARAITST